MPGKHSKEFLEIKRLEELVILKEKEIKDVKGEFAEQFKLIKDLCFCNDYNGKLNKLNKIYEIASDNFSILVKDLSIFGPKESENTKIIELHTRKSNK